MSEFVERPWGRYKILHQDLGYLVKLLVFTGGSIRPQVHSHRDERWTVIEGDLELGHGEHLHTSRISGGDTVSIPRGCWHQVGGHGKILELWIGDHLSEDDIEVRDLP